MELSADERFDVSDDDAAEDLVRVAERADVLWRVSRPDEAAGAGLAECAARADEDEATITNRGDRAASGEASDVPEHRDRRRGATAASDHRNGRNERARRRR